MSDSPVARAAASMETSTLLIVVGLTMAWLLGLIGGIAFDSGDDAQAILFSLAAIGGTTAAFLLAVRHLGIGLVLSAAGFLFFAAGAIAESVAGYTGAGSESVLGNLAILHLPAFLLIALQDWSPTWARAAAALHGLLFAIVGYDYVLGDEAFDVDSPLLILGYLALAVAAIGWALTVYGESTTGTRTGATPTRS